MSTTTKAGRYELREELGRGAMGVVYHAHDPVIRREVAVKTMHLSEAGTGMSREELVGRFQTEARAAGLLTHPNIVVIYDAGEEEGLFFITMELVEGRSLQTLLDSRQLFPLPRVIKLMEQVCSALDFAHQHNVVHRDIKPANLMLTSDDTVKITDFGTAKILQFGTAQTAHVMGTPSYMSPEQVKGKPVDGRSDIFSLGVILYEMMTGEKPFPGQNITTVIYKIINEEPISPRSLDSSIHPGLSTVITRALAKDPSARFQTCQELLNALKNYHELAGSEAATRIPPAVAQSHPGAIRGSNSLPRASAQSLRGNSNETDVPFQLVSPAAMAREQSSKSRVNIGLSLLLLAVIGFAGYRIWPPMVDLWQRAHGSAEQPATLQNAVPAPPVPETTPPGATSDATSDTKIDAVPQLTLLTPKAVPATELSAPQTPPQQTPQKASLAMIAPAPAVKPAPHIATPANMFEAQLRSELKGQPLAAKVKMQVTENTLTLSGKVSPSEHRELLNHLHDLPAGVQISDNLEYTDSLKETPEP